MYWSARMGAPGRSGSIQSRGAAMTKQIIGTMAGLAIAATALHAQGGGGIGIGVGAGGGRSGPALGQFMEQLQQAGTISAVGFARGGGGISAVNLTAPVVGRPVSGMEERVSTQTL